MNINRILSVLSIVAVLGAASVVDVNSNAKAAGAISVPPISPISVDASISPTPVVGQKAVLHIEISSRRDSPNTKLQITMSEGVEFEGENASWQGDIRAGQTISIDRTIRESSAKSRTLTTNNQGVRWSRA